MGKRGKKYKPEKIITKLRQTENLQSQGSHQSQICKEIGATPDTYIHWRKEYGGMRADQVKRLNDCEKENLHLKKIVTDLSLDKAMFEEVTKGNF